MSFGAWHEEPISKKHGRKSFDCGDPLVNEFLQRYARQSHECGAAKTFLAIDNADTKTILVFYSLAPGALAYAETPETVRRGPRATRCARLPARADCYRFAPARLRSGGQLLAATARRCLRAAAEAGGVVLIIDAKNDRAVPWYMSYGAVALSNKPLTLVMPLATFAADLKAAGQL